MNIASSKIFLDNLRFHAYHGVIPQENVVGNDYIVSVELTVDISDAANTDELPDTINYAEIYELVKIEMFKPSKLIEHLSARIAKSIFRKFSNIKSCKIRLSKLNPPMNADCDAAGVEAEFVNE